MNTELTVIIPFKNEGEEVGKTIRSLNDMACGNINVIVINDASDDGYDYSSIASEKNVKYIIHKESLGPAQSRAHGVKLCETEYFLLLDAHMRALTKGWNKLIIEELKTDKRAIYCCKTTDFSTNSFSHIHGIGAILDSTDLTCCWNNCDLTPEKTTTSISCLLGASYCTNKNYWNKIHGYEGLCSYGLEEQLLSIKTLLEGGNCYVIKTVLFAHKFREIEKTPYKISKPDFIFNELYIIETLFPLKLKKMIFQNIKRISNDYTFEIAMSKIANIRNKIKHEKNYYESIFSRDFKYITQLSNILKLNAYEKKI